MREMFKNRRQNVFAQIGEALLILPASKEMLRSRDVFFPFRQNSDFYYLTDFNEPEALLLLDGKTQQSILISKEYDALHAIWEGEIIGQDRAKAEYGFDAAYPLEQLETVLQEQLFAHEVVYAPFSQHPDFDQRLMRLIKTVKETRRARSPQQLLSSDQILHRMRLQKEPFEIEQMQIANTISSAAHCAAMRATRVGQNEFEIAALFDYEFAKAGTTWAYGHIVAGGNNACVLHYRNNNAPLRNGDLLLIDAGCEYQFYAADITRTFPINGRFTPLQKQAYDWVLKAQLAAIETCRLGNHIRSPHEAARDVLVDGMLDLGLLQGNKDDIIAQGLEQKYFMHGTSHWLGIDVHDVGEYKTPDDQWLPLETGMVLTVEPGLYIRADDDSAPAGLRGLGIRIEDNVVITEGAAHNLSSACPKTTEEIEAHCTD